MPDSWPLCYFFSSPFPTPLLSHPLFFPPRPFRPSPYVSRLLWLCKNFFVTIVSRWSYKRTWVPASRLILLSLNYFLLLRTNMPKRWRHYVHISRARSRWPSFCFRRALSFIGAISRHSKLFTMMDLRYSMGKIPLASKRTSDASCKGLLSISWERANALWLRTARTWDN